ncbi:MAG: hypothetical protein RBR88_05950, partial [Candidatus Saccharicenans sp.]|nr:hypothetical protein [Candidatus Saccharicenans sp.]
MTVQQGVQIFTPTLMTRSTCMYYTGVNPETGEAVYVPGCFAEKKAQKLIIAVFLRSGLTKEKLKVDLPGPRKITGFKKGDENL